MKNISNILEKLDINNIPEDDQYDILKKEIPKLELMLKNKYKIPVKLDVFIDRDKEKVSISSKDLMDNIKEPIIRAIFKELYFDFWGGNYDEESNMFYFRIHMDYKHTTGGSNGVELPEAFLRFDCKEKRWMIQK